jgi:hypothetical protein
MLKVRIGIPNVERVMHCGAGVVHRRASTKTRVGARGAPGTEGVVGAVIIASASEQAILGLRA